VPEKERLEDLGKLGDPVRDIMRQNFEILGLDEEVRKDIGRLRSIIASLTPS